MTAPSAYERTKKLERSGVILDYCAEIDYGKFGYSLHAFILLKDDKARRDATEFLLGIKSIHNCWVIAGEYDYMIEAYLMDNKELSCLIDHLFDQVGRTYTLIIIRNAKYSPYGT